MESEKEASVRCAQLKERTVKREAGLTPVGLQSIGFAFVVMNSNLLLLSNIGSLHCEE